MANFRGILCDRENAADILKSGLLDVVHLPLAKLHKSLTCLFSNFTDKNY